MDNTAFSIKALELDCAQETEKIIHVLREVVMKRFKKKGVVVALSGGIDSSVVVALCVRAFRKERVLGLLMPERDSAQETLELSRLISNHLEISTVCEDITGILEAVGCYRRREMKRLRALFPSMVRIINARLFFRAFWRMTGIGYFQ